MHEIFLILRSIYILSAVIGLYYWEVLDFMEASCTAIAENVFCPSNHIEIAMQSQVIFWGWRCGLPFDAYRA